ncbi:MAG: prolipoprotein diacylglyceryl transferase [Eubacteriales bacterium]
MSDTINILSFPGLGIGEFSLNTVAFQIPIFDRTIVWYGIIVTCGIIAGFLYVMYRSKYERIKGDDVLDIAILTIISAMIGARLYYVVMNLDHYNTFLDVIAIWNGGIAIYGGIIGGALAAFIVSKVKKLKSTKLYDMIVPGVMLGQVIGRWGNFINAEAFGTETSLPWRMGIHKIGSYVYDLPIYVHPTFLYESVWNAIGFILINLFYKKKKYDGQIFLLYIVWYGFGRMFIEGLRTDSLMIGDTIRVSQLLAFLSVLIGLIVLVICDYKIKKQTVIKESVIISLPEDINADMNKETVTEQSDYSEETKTETESENKDDSKIN